MKYYCPYCKKLFVNLEPNKWTICSCKKSRATINYAVHIESIKKQKTKLKYPKEKK